MGKSILENGKEISWTASTINGWHYPLTLNCHPDSLNDNLIDGQSDIYLYFEGNVFGKIYTKNDTQDSMLTNDEILKNAEITKQIIDKLNN